MTRRTSKPTLTGVVTTIVATAFLGIVSAAQATPVEMVVNGEFEDTGDLGGGLAFIANGSMPGWSCSSGSCELWGNFFGGAPNLGSDGLLTGNHHEITNGTGIQTTTQAVLSGASAAIADFSFDMWPRAGSGVTWSVFGSVSGLLSSGTVTGPGNVWTNTSVTGLVLAPGETITLAFRSLSATSVGEHIDGVSFLVRAVPEPGTLALLGIGLFGMGLARRRKA